MSDSLRGAASPSSSNAPSSQKSRDRAYFLGRLQFKIAPVYFLAPALFMFSVFVLMPIVRSLWLSLHEWDGFGPATWVGFENFATLFQDERFYTSLRNNLIWLILLLLAPPIGLAVSLFLNQRMKGMRFVKSIFFFPFVVNLVVVGLMFSWFYNPGFGLLSEILALFGREPFSILDNENLATYGIISAALWPQVAYCIILYITGLTAVDTQLIEAGKIDGAAGFKLLRHIVLPQLRPVTFIAIVITIIGALRSFDLVAIMTAGGPWGSSYVLAYHMYDETFFNFKMGYGASIATILFLVMDVYIVYFLVRLLRREK